MTQKEAKPSSHDSVSKYCRFITAEIYLVFVCIVEHERATSSAIKSRTIEDFLLKVSSLVVSGIAAAPELRQLKNSLKDKAAAYVEKKKRIPTIEAQQKLYLDSVGPVLETLEEIHKLLIQIDRTKRRPDRKLLRAQLDIAFNALQEEYRVISQRAKDQEVTHFSEDFLLNLQNFLDHLINVRDFTDPTQVYWIIAHLELNYFKVSRAFKIDQAEKNVKKNKRYEQSPDSAEEENKLHALIKIYQRLLSTAYAFKLSMAEAGKDYTKRRALENEYFEHKRAFIHQVAQSLPDEFTPFDIELYQSLDVVELEDSVVTDIQKLEQETDFLHSFFINPDEQLKSARQRLQLNDDAVLGADQAADTGQGQGTGYSEYSQGFNNLT